MTAEFLYDYSLGLILLGTLVLLFVAQGLGFRLGLREKERADDRARGQVNAIQAAVLGLLALILGFSFAMAAARFDSQRQLVLQEANAIGTTYLRAVVLPDAVAREFRNRMRDYVDARLDFFDSGADKPRLLASVEASERVQLALWRIAARPEDGTPISVARGLLIQSLNEMIDLHSERVTAMETHVPQSIILVLAAVALLSMGMVGFAAGVSGTRSIGAAALLSLMIAVVICVIIDLDRPRYGLIRVSQRPMSGLRDTIDKYDPEAARSGKP